MTDFDVGRRFDAVVLEHLDAAFTLARWILRDNAAAEDALQEASLRAYQYLRNRTVEHPKAWFMAIVRNACFDWLREHRRTSGDEPFDEKAHDESARLADNVLLASDPESEFSRAADARWLRECIARLPAEFREVIVLRELEELSYREISVVIDAPIGTVMSRLSRGRDLLHRSMLDASRRSKR